MPGSMPATSQLDWLISTTVMIVLSWSRATRDLLKSFGWGIRALHQLATATMVPSPRRLPHTISPLRKPDSNHRSRMIRRFRDRLMSPARNSGQRTYGGANATRGPRGRLPRDRWFESGFLQRGVRCELD